MSVRKLSDGSTLDTRYGLRLASGDFREVAREKDEKLAPVTKSITPGKEVNPWEGEQKELMGGTAASVRGGNN